MTEEKKISKKVEELVEEVAKLSVLELSELVSALQEKLGISAIPQVANAAPTGQVPAEAPVADDGNKTVIMAAAGDQKINVIKALREINPNLTLMDAKGMTEATPAEVLKDAKAEDAKAAADKLKASGATVELK